jgi:FMN phosphatase YigB (HAD superfamily)
MKREMGVKESFDKGFDRIFDKYEPEVCLGREVDSLLPIFEEKFSIKFPKNYSMLNDFVKRFNKNESIWPAVKVAKETGRVGLLTDMYPRMLNGIKRFDLLPPFTWDVIVDSSLEKLKKPDPKIFRLAEEKAGVKNNEILFIDNSVKNIEAAKKMGWQTFFYDSSAVEESSNNLLKFLRENQ